MCLFKVLIFLSTQSEEKILKKITMWLCSVACHDCVNVATLVILVSNTPSQTWVRKSHHITSCHITAYDLWVLFQISQSSQRQAPVGHCTLNYHLEFTIGKLPVLELALMATLKRINLSSEIYRHYKYIPPSNLNLYDIWKIWSSSTMQWF